MPAVGRPAPAPAGVAGGGGAASNRRSSTLASIQKLEQARAERRQKAERARVLRAVEEKRNIANGNPGDIDFQRLIELLREERSGTEQQHCIPGELKICIAVRKRPTSEKERKRKDHDSVSIFNPQVAVHNCKLKVDGITKYLDNTDFQFDHTFGEEDTTEDVYVYTAAPLVPFVVEGGRATVFAYGQTGSGKTYTMVGIQQRAAEDLFGLLREHPRHNMRSIKVLASFFEIYGGRCQDLLNKRHRLNVREDGQGDVHVAGLEQFTANSAEELEKLIDEGNRNRTTHATQSNDTSSRSHAICQISLIDVASGRIHGRLCLIDLAGSERGADTKSHNRQRRMEGAEINKSLLALKECIRALDSGGMHVPYRASKLTLVLKDSFTRKEARTVMIATVSPGASCADHTLNTLRYADRVKEQRVDNFSKLSPRESISPTGGACSPSGRRSPSRRQRSSHTDAPKPISPSSDVASHPSQHEPPPPPPDESISPPPRRNASSSEAGDDIQYLHDTIRKYNTADSEEIVELHRTVQSLFEEEEALLNLHMNVIQENAELLTEEGRLLQQIQGDNIVDYDIDMYAARLSTILERKMSIMTMLKARLNTFRQHLEDEESVSKKVSHMPLY